MPEDHIPLPLDPGSSGLQKPESGTPDLIVHDQFGGNQFATAVEGIAAMNPNSLGGKVGSTMIVASAQKLELEIISLRSRLESIEKDFKEQRDALEKSNINGAVLAARIESEGRNKNLRFIGFGIGVGLLSVAYNIAVTGFTPEFFVALVSGTLLTLFSWLAHPRGGAS